MAQVILSVRMDEETADLFQQFAKKMIEQVGK